MDLSSSSFIELSRRHDLLIEAFPTDRHIILTCYREITQCVSNLMNDYNPSLSVFLETDTFALKYLKNCSVNDNVYVCLNDILGCLWQKQTHLQRTINVLNGDRVSECPTVEEVCGIISTPENVFFQFMLGTVDNNSNIQTLVNDRIFDGNLLEIIYGMLYKK
jgi:hypothetical protein